MLINRKDILRKQALMKRKMIVDKEKKSHIIVNKIIGLECYQKAQVIGLYKSMKDEIMMDELISYSLYCGKKVLLPRVVGNKLLFLEYSENDILEKSSFNVLEPLLDNHKIYVSEIDLMIVPGLLFDKNNYRLGYGKAFYDRFFNNCDTYKIGVCFQEEFIEKLPIDKWDIKMDQVITDNV